MQEQRILRALHNTSNVKKGCIAKLMYTWILLMYFDLGLIITFCKNLFSILYIDPLAVHLDRIQNVFFVQSMLNKAAAENNEMHNVSR